MRAAAVLLSLGVIAAACGSSADEAADEPPPTTVAVVTDTAAPTDTEVAAGASVTTATTLADSSAATTTVPETTVAASATTTTSDTTATTTVPETATTEALLPAPSEVGAITPLGPGTVVGVSTNETVAWVLDTDPTGALGCEGEPGLALFTVPIDGGSRGLAIDIPVTSIRTSLDGRVVTEYICEGFFVAAHVARDDGTGRLVDVSPLNLPIDTVPGSIRLDGPNVLTYVVRDQFDPTSVGSLYEMDLNSFESFLLTETDVWDAVRVSEGRTVQRSSTALFVDGYDLINLDTGVGPFGAEVLPSEFGARLAVNTFSDITVLSGPDLTDIRVVEGTAAVHDWSGDQFLLLGPLSTGIGLRILDAAGGEITVLETPPPFAGARFARQGAAIVMSTPGVDLFSPVVVLVELS